MQSRCSNLWTSADCQPHGVCLQVFGDAVCVCEATEDMLAYSAATGLCDPTIATYLYFSISMAVATSCLIVSCKSMWLLRSARKSGIFGMDLVGVTLVFLISGSGTYALNLYTRAISGIVFAAAAYSRLNIAVIVFVAVSGFLIVFGLIFFALAILDVLHTAINVDSEPSESILTSSRRRMFSALLLGFIFLIVIIVLVIKVGVSGVGAALILEASLGFIIYHRTYNSLLDTQRKVESKTVSARILRFFSDLTANVKTLILSLVASGGFNMATYYIGLRYGSPFLLGPLRAVALTIQRGTVVLMMYHVMASFQHLQAFQKSMASREGMIRSPPTINQLLRLGVDSRRRDAAKVSNSFSIDRSRTWSDAQISQESQILLN